MAAPITILVLAALLYLFCHNIDPVNVAAVRVYGAVIIWFAIVGACIWWIISWDEAFQHHRNWFTISVSLLLGIGTLVPLGKMTTAAQNAANVRGS
jgi:xanthine/uracil permease